MWNIKCKKKKKKKKKGGGGGREKRETEMENMQLNWFDRRYYFVSFLSNQRLQHKPLYSDCVNAVIYMH